MPTLKKTKYWTVDHGMVTTRLCIHTKVCLLSIASVSVASSGPGSASKFVQVRLIGSDVYDKASPLYESEEEAREAADELAALVGKARGG